MINVPPASTTKMQLLYYGIIGIISNVCGYIIFLLMTQWGLGPKAAMSLLYLSCMIMSYFSNWKLTFKGQGQLATTSLRFLLTHFLGYFLNFIVLLIFVDYLGYPYAVIEAIAIILVAGYLFILLKLFVFSNSKECT